MKIIKRRLTEYEINSVEDKFKSILSSYIFEKKLICRDLSASGGRLCLYSSDDFKNTSDISKSHSKNIDNIEEFLGNYKLYNGKNKPSLSVDFSQSIKMAFYEHLMKSLDKNEKEIFAKMYINEDTYWKNEEILKKLNHTDFWAHIRGVSPFATSRKTTYMLKSILEIMRCRELGDSDSISGTIAFGKYFKQKLKKPEFQSVYNKMIADNVSPNKEDLYLSNLGYSPFEVNKKNCLFEDQNEIVYLKIDKHEFIKRINNEAGKINQSLHNYFLEQLVVAFSHPNIRNKIGVKEINCVEFFSNSTNAKIIIEKDGTTDKCDIRELFEYCTDNASKVIDNSKGLSFSDTIGIIIDHYLLDRKLTSNNENQIKKPRKI